jgi:hypothetical protein
MCVIHDRVIQNLIPSLWDVLLGYSGTQKAYRCYSPTIMRYFISSYVIFMEFVPYFESGTFFTPESVLSILKFPDRQISSFSNPKSGMSQAPLGLLLLKYILEVVRTSLLILTLSRQCRIMKFMCLMCRYIYHLWLSNLRSQWISWAYTIRSTNSCSYLSIFSILH